MSGAPSRSLEGAAVGYKALDLPGFAHHVIAMRGAAGYTDGRAISAFSAGGLSGSSLEVLSGFSVGDGPRRYGVRGFPPSAERGIRAFAGSLVGWFWARRGSAGFAAGLLAGALWEAILITTGWSSPRDQVAKACLGAASSS